MTIAGRRQAEGVGAGRHQGYGNWEQSACRNVVALPRTLEIADGGASIVLEHLGQVLVPRGKCLCLCGGGGVRFAMQRLPLGEQRLAAGGVLQQHMK